MIHRYRQMDPAHAIGVQRRDRVYLAVLDCNEGDAFGAALADMAALKIAAKHDMRPFMQDRGVVNMRERPVIIAFVDQILDGARRIIGMASHSAEASVQDTDVEAAGDG